MAASTGIGRFSRIRVASGFNRNNGTTDEGGAIAEEYRVEYAVDRVKTTSTVWLGLTMECAQCHDPKYDPISQRDYYAMAGVFRSSDLRAGVRQRPRFNAVYFHKQELISLE